MAWVVVLLFLFFGYPILALIMAWMILMAS
jgi:hypothetical protein